jgi:LPXTG-site transpeptidase (sortase) family protein
MGRPKKIKPRNLSLQKYIPVILTIVGLSFFLNRYSQQINASEASQKASDFVQWCNDNNSICQKTDNSGRQGQASCPGSGQTVAQIYVHAGNGQTIYLLPDSQFSYQIQSSLAQVSVLSGHDLSWIAVVCGQVSPTPTNTPTPTSTPSPTLSPSPTATPTSIPTPTPTDTPPCFPTKTPSPTPTPTFTPSPTSTSVPDPTATPSEEIMETPTPTPTETHTPPLSPTPSPSVTSTPQPTSTPEPGPTSTPEPGPTSTPGPNPTPTPQPGVGGEAPSSPTTTPNPSVLGIVRTLSAGTDNFNPLVQGIRDSLTGEVLGVSFPPTGEKIISRDKLPSDQTLIPNHYLLIPRLNLNQPVYQAAPLGADFLVGNQEVDLMKVNQAPLYYAHSYQVGLFKNLNLLRVGDEIFTDSEGQSRTYRVSRITTVTADDLSAVVADTNTVYLLTCIDSNHRLLVQAKLSNYEAR